MESSPLSRPGEIPQPWCFIYFDLATHFRIYGIAPLVQSRWNSSHPNLPSVRIFRVNVENKKRSQDYDFSKSSKSPRYPSSSDPRPPLLSNTTYRSVRKNQTKIRLVENLHPSWSFSIACWNMNWPCGAFCRRHLPRLVEVHPQDRPDTGTLPKCTECPW